MSGEKAVKTCKICFKRTAGRDGICNVCHGCADDARQRTVYNAALTDEWAKRFVREIKEKRS